MDIEVSLKKHKKKIFLMFMIIYLVLTIICGLWYAKNVEYVKEHPCDRCEDLGHECYVPFSTEMPGWYVPPPNYTEQWIEFERIRAINQS